MKKTLFVISFLSLLLTEKMFCQNLISNQTFETKNLKFIKIKTETACINVESYISNEILVEVSSNNNHFRPQINIIDGNLQIEEHYINYSKGDNCTISIFVPVSFTECSYLIDSGYGNINVQNIHARDSIEIKGGDGKISASSLTTEFFSYTGQNPLGPLTEFSKITCEFFKIESTAENIRLELTKAPVAQSTFHVKTGDIYLVIPPEEDFNLSVSSFRGQVFNNLEGQSEGRAGFAEIILKNHTGNIYIN